MLLLTRHCGLQVTPSPRRAHKPEEHTVNHDELTFRLALKRARAAEAAELALIAAGRDPRPKTTCPIEAQDRRIAEHHQKCLLMAAELVRFREIDAQAAARKK